MSWHDALVVLFYAAGTAYYITALVLLVADHLKRQRQ